MYSVGNARTKCSSTQRLLEPVVSKDFVQMDGVPINGICQQRHEGGNERPKELSANICGSEPESSDLPVKLFVFPNLREMHDLVIGLSTATRSGPII